MSNDISFNFPISEVDIYGDMYLEIDDGFVRWRYQAPGMPLDELVQSVTDNLNAQLVGVMLTASHQYNYGKRLFPRRPARITRQVIVEVQYRRFQIELVFMFPDSCFSILEVADAISDDHDEGTILIPWYSLENVVNVGGTDGKD